MQHVPLTVVHLAHVRRSMAATGAVLGLVAAATVFGTSVGRLPLTKSFLRAEALALLAVGPGLGALVGVAVVRMRFVATGLVSLAFCLVAPFVVGAVVALILPATDSSFGADRVMRYATIGAEGYSLALGAYAVLVAFVLSWRRARLLSEVVAARAHGSSTARADIGTAVRP